MKTQLPFYFLLISQTTVSYHQPPPRCGFLSRLFWISRCVQWVGCGLQCPHTSGPHCQRPETPLPTHWEFPGSSQGPRAETLLKDPFCLCGPSLLCVTPAPVPHSAIRTLSPSCFVHRRPLLWLRSCYLDSSSKTLLSFRGSHTWDKAQNPSLRGPCFPVSGPQHPRSVALFAGVSLASALEAIPLSLAGRVPETFFAFRF